jgi:phage baseplate assembly protein W
MSGLAFPLSGGLGGESSISPAADDFQLARFFGKDMFFDVSNEKGADLKVNQAGDWLLVSGKEALRQAVLRRIVTNPGEWKTLPDYGVGARLYVKTRNTRASRDELVERIRSQLLRDTRIEKVNQVVVELTDGVLRIAVQITPFGQAQRAQPFSIAIEVQ